MTWRYELEAQTEDQVWSLESSVTSSLYTSKIGSRQRTSKPQRQDNGKELPNPDPAAEAKAIVEVQI